MRIISGKAKGIRLGSLKGLALRPTLDRVRESFFNQVSPVIKGAWFLDLFAGAGAVGIEALSRGAEKVVFVEPHPGAERLIRQNLLKCRFAEEGHNKNSWVLIKTSAVEAIRILEKKGQRFDLIYVDPPFEDNLYDDTLLELSASKLLQETSQVIVEHFRKTGLEKNYGKLSLIKSRRLGDSCLSFFG